MSFHRRIRTIYGKELTDILRDRRTLIAMIVVPIVLYPLLMLGSIQAVTFQAESRSINGDGTVTTLGTLATAAGSGSVGDMSLSKILIMMRIFNEADVDPDIPKHWAITPKDVEDMLDIDILFGTDEDAIRGGNG